MFVAYVHMKPDLTPFYVGKGSYERAQSLVASARNVWHGSIVSKYGKDNIIIESIECGSETEAFMRERLIIASLRASGVELCNLTDGGEGPSGVACSEETRELRRIRMIGNTNTKGTKRTESSIEKTRLAHVGSKRSEETKEKQRIASLGRLKSSEEIEKIRKNTSKRYTCDVCGHTTNAPNMTKHFRFTGHSGRSANLIGFMA